MEFNYNKKAPPKRGLSIQKVCLFLQRNLLALFLTIRYELYDFVQAIINIRLLG